MSMSMKNNILAIRKTWSANTGLRTSDGGFRHALRKSINKLLSSGPLQNLNVAAKKSFHKQLDHILKPKPTNYTSTLQEELSPNEVQLNILSTNTPYQYVEQFLRLLKNLVVINKEFLNNSKESNQWVLSFLNKFLNPTLESIDIDLAKIKLLEKKCKRFYGDVLTNNAGRSCIKNSLEYYYEIIFSFKNINAITKIGETDLGLKYWHYIQSVESHPHICAIIDLACGLRDSWYHPSNLYQSSLESDLLFLTQSQHLSLTDIIAHFESDQKRRNHSKQFIDRCEKLKKEFFTNLIRCSSLRMEMDKLEKSLSEHNINNLFDLNLYIQKKCCSKNKLTEDDPLIELYCKLNKINPQHIPTFYIEKQINQLSRELESISHSSSTSITTISSTIDVALTALSYLSKEDPEKPELCKTCLELIFKSLTIDDSSDVSLYLYTKILDQEFLFPHLSNDQLEQILRFSPREKLQEKLPTLIEIDRNKPKNEWWFEIDNECKICFDDILSEMAVIIPSGHCCLKSAILTWITEKKICPFTRKDLSESHLIQVDKIILEKYISPKTPVDDAPSVNESPIETLSDLT